MPATSANERAIADVVKVAPRLVGIKPAIEVVPGMRPDLILHAAPPTDWDSLAPSVRAALVGAAEFEGLSSTEAELDAAQDHHAMAGGAGAITASTPVVVVEDQAGGERAYHFLMEGLGRALILGMTGEDVFGRLRWLRDEAAPALDAAVQALGGIDCDEIMCEALARGDELHNRNAAATSMLAERLAPGLAVPGCPPSSKSGCFSSWAATPSSSWRSRSPPPS